MSKTEQNLLEAFAGESQANRKYLAFSKQAEKEGYPQAAKLFRAAAEAETVHAHAHLRALGQVKSTSENLKEAVAGEMQVEPAWHLGCPYPVECSHGRLPFVLGHRERSHVAATRNHSHRLFRGSTI